MFNSQSQSKSNFQAQSKSKSFSLNAMALPWPPNWDALFGRAAPLVLEIGFGNGKFLADLAAKQPDHNLIGIERAHAPLGWTEELVQKRALSHVRLVNADAYMALHCLFPQESLAAVHINFSDPWPKTRHHERRLIHPDFLSVLASRLQIGAMLYIATDISQYAGEIGLALGQTRGLKNATASPWMIQRADPSISTSYERKAQRVGRTCHYFEWRRTSDPIPHPPVPNVPLYNPESDHVQSNQDEINAMANANIQLPLSLEEIAAAFSPELHRNDDYLVKFMHVYQQTDALSLLFETLVDEALFSQRIMLMLTPRPQGHYLIKLHAAGYPRATPGVVWAVDALSNWLLSLHPEGRLLSGSLKF